jgi:hypothetical protein
MKQCTFDTPGATNSVTNEGWLDENNDNNWKKVFTWVDTGKGSGGSKCGTSDTAPGMWGGPELTFRSDSLTYNCMKISGREINPSGTFTDDVPSGGGGGGTGTGGTGTLVRQKYNIPAVTASGHATTDVENFAIDGNVATKWTSNTSATATITFDLGAQSKVDTVKLMFYQGSSIKYFFSIQYSIDNTNWINIGGARTSSVTAGTTTGIVKDWGNLVVSGPKIKLIYWGTTWTTTDAAMKTSLDTQIQALIASPYFSKLIQYRGIQRPTWGGSTINSTTALPSTFTIEQALVPIMDLMNASTIPKPSADPNVIYMVVASSSATLAGGIAGTHTIADYTGPGAGIIYYGSQHSFPTIGENTRVMGEEIVESMTSPGSLGLEGFLIAPPIGNQMNPAYSANQYVEINDPCSTTQGTVNGVSVFPYYSNLDTACVIPTVDYNPSAGLNEFAFTEVTARYIRLVCVGNNMGTGTTATENITRIAEAEIWGRQPGGGTTTPPPTPGPDPGDTGGGTGNPAAPPPVVTVFKDFTDSYHLAVEEGDLCGADQLVADRPLTSIYKAPAGNTMYLRLAMPGPDCIGADAMVGELVASSASKLVGKIVRQMSVTLKRTGSPDGYIYARIWDKNLVVQQDLGSFPALAVSFGVDQVITFTNAFATYALQKGDVIGVEYDDPSSSCDNYLAYRHCDANAEDAMNSVFCKFRDAIITDTLVDFAAEIFE